MAPPEQTYGPSGIPPINIVPLTERLDAIDHPPHYHANGVEAIEVIEAFGLDFLEGNTLKYLLRWRKKGGVTDLKKCAWYLNRLIANEEKRDQCK